MQKRVNLVDLVKSFQTSVYYLLAKLGVDTAENGPPKISQKLEQEVRTNIGASLLIVFKVIKVTHP